MKTTTTLCLAVLTAFGAAGARADDPAKTTDPPKTEEPAAKPPARPAGQQKQVDKLVAEFKGLKVTPEQVQALRDKGLGWGEVRHALTIAQRSGKTVDEVMKQRESGLGWGEIAKKDGVKLGPDRTGKGDDKGAGRGAGEGRGPDRDHGGAGREHGRGHK